MGGLGSRIQGFCGRTYAMNARVLMVGLDGAGKTTILYRLKLNKTVATIPNISHRVETLDLTTEVVFTLWDISTGSKGQPLLRHYLPGSHGIVLVVDSTDSERFGEAKELLFMLLYEWESTGLPLIVLANKQDLDGAHSSTDIARYLDLENLKGRKWAICGCCGTEGEGLLEAMEKLSTMIKEQRLETSQW